MKKPRKQKLGNRAGYVFSVRLNPQQRELLERAHAIEAKSFRWQGGSYFGLGSYVRHASLQRAAQVVRHARERA